MQQHSFGTLPTVSTLTLGGGGLGMLWGKTTFEECVATVHAAVEAGITLLDLAPRYGDGKAEEVVGEAFGGKLPAGVRVTSKCNLGNPPAGEIEGILRRSIEASLQRLRLTGSTCSSCIPTSCLTQAFMRRPGATRQPHDALRRFRRPGAAGVRALRRAKG